MAKLYTFRVIAGEHIGNKRTYKKGYTFQSRYPLDEMFVGKFYRVPDVPVIIDDEEGPAAHLIPEKVAAPQGKIKNTPTQIQFSFEDAVDVTNVFPKAKEAGLAVFKDDSGGYAVAEPDALVKVNLADYVLGSKKKVNEFLETFTVTSGPNDQD